MDFTQRRLEKVAGEQGLMLSLCLENEDLYLESGIEVLITLTGLLFDASASGCQHVKCSSRGWFPAQIWLSWSGSLVGSYVLPDTYIVYVASVSIA